MTQVVATPGTWAWGDARRVLIEHADPLAALAVETRLRRVGLAVATCHGPDARRRCPLVSGEGCALAAGADVIVSALQGHEEIAAAHGLRHPDTPLVEFGGALDAECVRTAVRVAIRGC